MEKKNPYKFTIGFKKQIPSHQRAAEILNQTTDKADLIAASILQYMGETESAGGGSATMENLRPWIIEMIRQEVKNAAGTGYAAQIAGKPDQILDLSDQKEMPDDNLAMNLMDIMNAFRRD